MKKMIFLVAITLIFFSGCKKESSVTTTGSDTVMYFQGWKSFHIKVDCGHTEVYVTGEIDNLSPKTHEFWKYDPKGNIFLSGGENTKSFSFKLPLNEHDCDSVVHILIRGCFEIHNVKYELEY